MISRPSIATLRRQLYARGFTPKPTCPRCKQERDPGDFLTVGWCRACESAPRVACPECEGRGFVLRGLAPSTEDCSGCEGYGYLVDDGRPL